MYLFVSILMVVLMQLVQKKCDSTLLALYILRVVI